MSRVVHFEIHADDPQRAMAFYGDVFGWTFEQFGEMEYWQIRTGPDGQMGINGGLTRRNGLKPEIGGAVSAFVCVIGVGDIEPVVAAIERHGCTAAMPLDTVPGVGRLAYYFDTESNIFGVIQPEM